MDAKLKSKNKGEFKTIQQFDKENNLDETTFNDFLKTIVIKFLVLIVIIFSDLSKKSERSSFSNNDTGEKRATLQ